MAEWYYRDSQETQQGPFDWYTLAVIAQSGSIRGTHKVWSRELGSWSPASIILGLPEDGSAPPGNYSAPFEPRSSATFLEPPGQPELVDARRCWRRIRAASIWFKAFAALAILHAAILIVLAAKAAMDDPDDAARHLAFCLLGLLIDAAIATFYFVGARAILRCKRWPLIVALIPTSVSAIVQVLALLLTAIYLLFIGGPNQADAQVLFLRALGAALITIPFLIAVIMALGAIPKLAAAPDWCRRAVAGDSGPLKATRSF